MSLSFCDNQDAVYSVSIIQSSGMPTKQQHRKKGRTNKSCKVLLIGSLWFESSSQILSPWPGDIVDSGIGLSYRSASLCSLAGWYENPLPESTLSLQSGTMNMATDSESQQSTIAQQQYLTGIVWKKSRVHVCKENGLKIVVLYIYIN